MFFDNKKIEFLDESVTEIRQSNDVYQDGTTPLCRDKNGTLWAISGHSHCGRIAMFKGTCLDDLKLAYPIRQTFSTGHADFAFNGVRYPEGVKARGSVWPMGLYICPETGRFYCFFHNEAGWRAMGTEYDAFGPCFDPKYDSDFRHIGMMHSDDEGKSWFFDRWVITADSVCFTENYNPDGVNVIPQKSGVISLGSGDFSIFVDEKGGYLYIIYDIITLDMNDGSWRGCDAYIARSRIRKDGLIEDFVKYYNGKFSEPGVLGRETPIAKNAWHARAVYYRPENLYLLTSTRVTPGKVGDGVKLVDDVMQIRVGRSLTEWGEPTTVFRDGKEWGNHYLAFVSDGVTGQPNIVTSDEFSLLSNHNGTDVIRYKVKITEK